MACPIRFAGVVRASAPHRLPDGRATQRRDDAHGARRAAKRSRNAGRVGVACRIAWPDLAASVAPASERES